MCALVAEADDPERRPLLALIDTCLESLRHHTTGFENHGSSSSLAVASHPAARPTESQAVTPITSVLPLHTCCCLVSSFLLSAIDNDQAGSSRGIQRKFTEELLPVALGMLRSSDELVRKAALKTVLPPLMAAVHQLGEL